MVNLEPPLLPICLQLHLRINSDHATSVCVYVCVCVCVCVHLYVCASVCLYVSVQSYSPGGHTGQQMLFSGSAGRGLGHIGGDSQCTVLQATSKA